MQPEFWHERWQLNQIGFHQDEVNPYLRKFWPLPDMARGDRVFVPLCGKSRDMLWLRDQGYDVVGVEVSELAVQAFFAENGLQASFRRQGRFGLYQAERISIYCGDFFDLTRADLAGVQSVYDRASLVALPPEMRADYAEHMLEMLSPQAQTLLVSFEYPQHQMAGPPFSVGEAEVRALYGRRCDIRLLHEQDILEREPRFREKGLSWLRESVYGMAYNAAF